MCAYGRVLAEPRLSPDGERLAFVTNVAGRGQLVVMPPEGGPEVVVTSDPPPRPVAAYGGGAFDWTPGRRSRSCTRRSTAGCGSHLRQGGVARPDRPKQPDGGCAAPAVSPDGTRVAFVVNQQHVAVAPIDGSAWPVRLSGGGRLLLRSVVVVRRPRWSWHEWDVPAMPWDEGRIVVRAASGSGDARVVAGGAGISVQQPRFSPDGARLAFLSDETGWLNLWVAAADGSDAKPLVEEPIEHGDPSWGLGQRSFAWSPDGTSIVFTRNHLGFGTIDCVDVATGETACARQGDPRRALVARRPHRGRAIGRAHADAAHRVRLTSATRAPTVARGPVGGFEAIDLPEPTAVTWEADDGATIHGRLVDADGSLPPPVEDPPPLLVWIHGGPTGQTTVAWNNRLPFFLERGWAVLFPDHRGSTGHGRAYAQAMAGRWGDLDTSDTAAGMRAAAERGWGDPHADGPDGRLRRWVHRASTCSRIIRISAPRGSTCSASPTCSTSTRRPTDSRRTTCTRSSVRCPTAADAYRDRSPINVADRITSPLLILQGDADEVVPPAQSRAIADRLRVARPDRRDALLRGRGSRLAAPGDDDRRARAHRVVPPATRAATGALTCQALAP